MELEGFGVQKSSSRSNIQGGQLGAAPELALHWDPKDTLAGDASFAKMWNAPGSAGLHLSVMSHLQKPVGCGVLGFSRREAPASNSPYGGC